MVNANVVISVSAVLVAVILTIVFVLRKTNPDFPSDNFSVSADGVTQDGGAASMYFCVGQECQFYDMDYTLNDFPGYFALVGLTKDGETFVTEHSVGFTFQFDAEGKLVKCYDSASLDGALVASRVNDLIAANTAGDTSYTVDGITWNGGVTWSTDLSVAPSVLGLTVPTPAECKAANSDPEIDKPAGDFGPDVGFDENVAPPPTSRRLTEDGESSRMLWDRNVANIQSTSWSLAAASAAYDNVPGANQVMWNSCVTAAPTAFGLKGSAVARFVYDPSGTTMALGFAGSDDYYDWILDLTRTRPECDSWYFFKPDRCVCQGASWWGPWYAKWYGYNNCYSGAPASPDGNLHWGFFAYQNMVADCVNNNVALLYSWGIDIDMITGHSLGGAAATVYRRLNSGRQGISTSQVSTWAAPKTIKGSSCSQPGWRHMDNKDPVASNGMGFLEGFNHDVQNAKRGNDDKSISTVWCGENAGGCSWLFDCAYYAATRHLLSNYKTMNW